MKPVKKVGVAVAPALPIWRTRLYIVTCGGCGTRFSARSRQAVDDAALEHYYYQQTAEPVGQTTHGSKSKF